MLKIIVPILLCLKISSQQSTRIIIAGDRSNTVSDEATEVVLAKVGDAPYFVSFKKISGQPIPDQPPGTVVYRSKCGGALIASSKTLTAAHCFDKEQEDDEEFEKMLAVMGNVKNLYTKQMEGQWRPLKSITFHPDYDWPKNDIAVVFVKTPFSLNDNIKTINYAKVFKDYKGECEVVGFRQTDPEEKDRISEELLIAYVKVLPCYVCKDVLKLGRKTVCVDTKPSNVAVGDFGSPLVCKDTEDVEEIPELGLAVGVYSDMINHHTTWSRTSSYMDFIENTGSHDSSEKDKFTHLGSQHRVNGDLFTILLLLIYDFLL